MTDLAPWILVVALGVAGGFVLLVGATVLVLVVALAMANVHHHMTRRRVPRR